MSTQLLIGASAGLVSAALFTSVATAGVLAGIPFYLSPLPLCLAGLGWGRATVLIAVLVGTLAMAIAISAPLALAFALMLALPIAALVHLLLLARPGTPQDGSGALDWYPPGRLVGWAALMAGVLAGILVLGLGPDVETYRQTVGSLLTPELTDMLDPDGSIFTPETVDSLKVVLAKALPAAFAIVWLIIVLFNLWLAGFIVETSGRALRPWPDLHGLEVPNGFVAVFAIALVLSFVPGILGLLATGFAAALLFTYVLQGLAVIHTYSRGLSLRPLLLTAIYIGILFLGWVAIVVAIIGLGEPLIGLRSRGSSPPSAPATKDNETD